MKKLPLFLGSCFKSRYAILAFGALLAVLSGCNHAANNAAKPQQPPPRVKIAQALQQAVTEWDEYPARVEAIESVEVRARVSGYLEKIHFRAGALVKQGELLFEIDPKPYAAQLKYAEAELKRAQSRYELAKNDLARAENLFRAKAISAEEHDARGKGLAEAAAAVQSAEATVETARLNLDYTRIRAPIAGRIGRESITAGNLVNADTTLLTFIVSTDPVYVYADVDERAALKYRHLAQQVGLAGINAELAAPGETGFPHRGRLDYLSPRADAGTGTVSIRAVFQNPDDLLSPGFFVRLRLQGTAPYPALLVPEKAVAADQAQRFVWVIDQNQQAQYRKVELGAAIGQSRVIRSGLTPDDWVVVEGLQKLKPGVKTEPERTPAGTEQ